jgi:hypothetical protein
MFDIFMVLLTSWTPRMSPLLPTQHAFSNTTMAGVVLGYPMLPGMGQAAKGSAA